jgi:hypothetical protein
MLSAYLRLNSYEFDANYPPERLGQLWNCKLYQNLGLLPWIDRQRHKPRIQWRFIVNNLWFHLSRHLFRILFPDSQLSNRPYLCILVTCICKLFPVSFCIANVSAIYSLYQRNSLLHLCDAHILYLLGPQLCLPRTLCISLAQDCSVRVSPCPIVDLVKNHQHIISVY